MLGFQGFLAGRIANKNPFSLWNTKEEWLVLLGGTGLAGVSRCEGAWHAGAGGTRLKPVEVLVALLLAHLLCSPLSPRDCCLCSNVSPCNSTD